MSSDPRGLRVALDARMADGGSGGIQQWVIGLAHAMSQLDGTDEYLFLGAEGRESWLRGYVSGPSRVIVARSPTKPEPGAAGRSAQRTWRNRIAHRLPLVRAAYRRVTGRAPASPQRNASAPASDASPALSLEHAAIAAAGAAVMHFTTQTGFRTSLPTVYQPWDLQHLHLPEFFTPERIREREAAYRGLCAQAAHIVVPTTWVKRDLMEQYGTTSERISVVNPPPVTWAYPSPTAEQEAEISARLQLPARFVFYPAVTWPHKNHERLIEAIALLHGRGIDVPLICSGRVHERHEVLRARAAELGVANLVRFVGFVDTTEMLVLYHRATALVFPSLYEGWGLPVVEAFAENLPVVTSTVTSLPELVGDAAVQFDPLDPSAIATAIERLWIDEGARAEYARRGRERVALFSWDETARHLRAIYREAARVPLEPGDRELLAAPPVV